MNHDQDTAQSVKHKRPNQHPQCIRDLQMHMMKIYNNRRLYAPTKVKELEALADKFRSGWPFVGTKYENYGQFFLPSNADHNNLLERQARALARRLHDTELVRMGRNVGTMDRTELDSAKIHTTAVEKKEEK